MSYRNPYGYDDPEFPWWAKALALVALACLFGLVQRCRTGQW